MAHLRHAAQCITLSTSFCIKASAVCRYIGIQERDFEWLTEQLVSLANKYCQGRIVSALEGGYRIHGGIVSAFARSVASHVRALNSGSLAEWNWADVQAEQRRERQRKVDVMH